MNICNRFKNDVKGNNKPLVLAVITLFLIQVRINSFGQIIDLHEFPISSIDAQLKTTRHNNKSAIDLVANFKSYPTLTQYRGQHLYSLNDSIFGEIPFKMFIPTSYDPSKPLSLILLLHGGVGQSTFKDAEGIDTLTEAETDPFYKKLCQLGYIIVMPYADPQKEFNWAANKFNNESNATFDSLIKIINELKKSINIDDNKVFAFGHSDGADGAFALDVYHPEEFAGFVAYNSMLSVLFADDFYINNTVNRPLYLVHSDEDELRPIEQTRAIVKILDSLRVPVTYKEYAGYKHFDAHLSLDFPNSIHFLDTVQRNPYHTSVYLETDTVRYGSCDWLSVKGLDLTLPKADWHKTRNTLAYDKKSRTWFNFNYYYRLRASAAIQGYYRNNIFEIKTSRVIKFEILISPQMVDMNKNITVVVNGKKVFTGRVTTDDTFFSSHFLTTHDRKAIWVNSIKVNVPGPSEY